MYKTIGKSILLALLLWHLCPPRDLWAGPLGPPQPTTRTGQGIHTAFGFWQDRWTYDLGPGLSHQESQFYSELGYGHGDRWEVFGRVGVSELTIGDAHQATDPATVVTRRDLADRWGIFATGGAKIYFPLYKGIGVGAIVQGTYFFRGFSDGASGLQAGVPFGATIEIDRLWKLDFGIALQTTLPRGIKAYFGPCFRVLEIAFQSTPAIPGLLLGAPITHREEILGGFAGIEIPLGRGFRLNLEGQYTNRLSLGSAVSFVY